mmetsp:Transcript_39233/g.104141  ORF Transcript_39233/g.104141 Transcript_39233/m.104141 type:complete len:94 (-) Transcript_39233:585-866(-)
MEGRRTSGDELVSRGFQWDRSLETASDLERERRLESTLAARVEGRVTLPWCHFRAPGAARRQPALHLRPSSQELEYLQAESQPAPQLHEPPAV